jgi:HEAT repeat protein
MRKSRFMLLVFALAMVVGGQLAARGPAPITESVEQADVIVRVTVQKSAQGRLQYEVAKVYKGEALLPARTPKVIALTEDTNNIPFLGTGLRPAEEAVLFLKKPAAGQDDFSAGGFSPWKLEPATREEDLQAIEHLLQTWALPDEKIKVEIMMSDLQSRHTRLRWAAHSYIAQVANRSPQRLTYQEHYLKLLASEDRWLMSLGLSTLQNNKITQAIPRLISLTRDPDSNLVGRVSLALANYPDNPEVRGVLVGLTRHPCANVRVRAMIDLDHFDHPEVTMALLERLRDVDPEVRKMVPRAFHFKSEETCAALNPKLLALLKAESDPKVRAAAITGLGDQVTVEQRLLQLRQKDVDADLAVALLGSLYSSFVHMGNHGAHWIRDNEDLFVGYVMRKDHHMLGFNALCILDLRDSPKVREITRQAAQEHPLSYVRDLARHLAQKRAAAKIE